MSKKNRAQHSTPRRHGDRNVQTRYSGKHQCGEHTHTCDGSCCEVNTGGKAGKAGGASNAVCMDGLGLILIPEVKVKIRELHIHLDDHMETYNFHSGSMATVLHGSGGAAEVETGFEEEENNGEEE